ncbi:hypothetical protein [Streptomyces sp. NPDC054765]
MHPTGPGHSATAVDALSLGAAALGNLFRAVSDEDTAATAMISHPVPEGMWLALRAQGLLPPGVPVPVPRQDGVRP